MKMILLLFEIILTFVCLQSEGADTKDLYVVVHVPFPDDIYFPGWDGGPSLVPGVQLAVEQINNRSDIIPGYKIRLIISDSGCNLYLKARVSQVTNVILGPDPVVGIIGPACSEAALATAPIQNKLKMIQITTATTPLLNDHGKYPFTFGIVSAATIYADAIHQLITENQWTSVAIFYEIDRPYFSFTFTHFLETFPPELIGFASGITSSYIPLEELWDARTRVIIVLASTKLAGLVMCLAHHKKILFPSFQFLFIDREMHDFVEPTTVSHRGMRYECSKGEMMTAINGVILNHYDLAPNEPDTTLVSQSTFADFEVQYDKKREDYGQEINANISSSVWANPFYDATWALALSVNTCISEIASDNFSDLSCIRNEMHNVNFNGATGNVSFDNVTGHASTVVDINQVNNNNTILLGYYSAREIHYLEEGMFVDNLFEKELIKVPVRYAVIMFVVAALAFVLTISFHLINIWKREHPSIKATSPKLNNLIYLGCYLLITTIVIVTLQEAFPRCNESYGSGLCNASVWAFTTAYTLIFGTVCVKAWRLFFIFNHTFKKDQFLSNKSLLIFVSLLLSLNFVICILWYLVDPVTQGEEVTVRSGGSEPVILTRVFCQYSSTFIIIEAMFLGVLAFVVVYLSIYNRRIKKKDFRYTTSVTVFVYSFSLVLALGIPIYIITLSIDYTLGYFAICIMLIFMVFSCIILLFFPPAIPILKRLKKLPVRLCCSLAVAQ